jgi:hypothetical protein
MRGMCFMDPTSLGMVRSHPRVRSNTMTRCRGGDRYWPPSVGIEPHWRAQFCPITDAGQPSEEPRVRTINVVRNASPRSIAR